MTLFILYLTGFAVTLIWLTAYDTEKGLDFDDLDSNLFGAFLWPIVFLCVSGYLIGKLTKERNQP